MHGWKLAAILGVALIGAGELFARHLGLGHPLIYKPGSAGYEPVPNQTIIRLGKTMHVNSLGTRGPQTTPLPATGIERIMVLGDSVANGGAQMNDDQTWPLAWEALLRQGGKRVEVVNASAGGWAVSNEAAWLDKHGVLGARMVVLEINEKDLDQPFAGSDTLDRNVSFPSHPPATALSEVILRYVLPHLGLGAASADPGSTDGLFNPHNTQSVMDSLERIRQRAAAEGASLAILYWDVRLPTPPGAVAARDRLLAYAAQHGVQIVRPNLREARFFHDDIHPNANGCQTIAAILATRLHLT